jgi:hypothetical protein
MTERTKPLRVAIDDGVGPIVLSHSPLERFLMRALETSDDIYELLALFDGPQENVARRLAGLHGGRCHSFCESVARNKRRSVELPISIEN